MPLLLSYMTRTNLLLVVGFKTPNSDLWERDLKNLLHVSNFTSDLYQVNPILWKIPNSERKGKHSGVLVTWWNPNIYY